MSVIRKAVQLLKGLFVASAIPPLFVSVQSTLPGRRQLFGSNFSVCDEKALREEMRLRGIEPNDELQSRFNTGVRQALSPHPEQQRMASATFQSLVETPLGKTTTLHADLGVAHALSNQLEEGLTATEKARASLQELPLLETDSMRKMFSTTIIDNEAEIRRRLGLHRG